MNELETQLRSWALRRPSPKVDRALFGPSPAPRNSNIRVNWLAPAMAGMVVLLTFMNLRPGGRFERMDRSYSLPIMVSNCYASAVMASSASSDRNAAYPNTFEWTNERGFTSSITSFSSSRGTNN